MGVGVVQSTLSRVFSLELVPSLLVLICGVVWLWCGLWCWLVSGQFTAVTGSAACQTCPFGSGNIGTG